MKAITWKATFAAMSPSPVFEAVADFAERLTLSRVESRYAEIGRASDSPAPGALNEMTPLGQ
jgi:hypothetical protein